MSGVSFPIDGSVSTSSSYSTAIPSPSMTTTIPGIGILQEYFC